MTLRFTIYIFLVAASIPFGIYHWKKLRLPIKILVCMLLIVFISESLTRVTNVYLKTSMPMYHILVAFELLLFPIIYLSSFPATQKYLRVVVGIVSLAGPFFSIIWSTHSNIMQTFPSGSILLLSVTIIACSLFGFVFLLKQPYLPLKENSFFWFNLGNLVFYTLTFLVFGLANPLAAQHGGMPDWGAEIIYYSNLTLYVCYFLTIYKEAKNHGSFART